MSYVNYLLIHLLTAKGHISSLLNMQKQTHGFINNFSSMQLGCFLFVFDSAHWHFCWITEVIFMVIMVVFQMGERVNIIPSLDSAKESR